MSCFPFSATCHGSHRNAEAALEYLDFLDENKPLDSTGVISDDEGSAISLQSDVGLEISGTEGESEAKSSDGKSLTTRVTIAMIRCAFLEVHVEEELFAEFGDEADIEDVEDESVEQEGPLGEGLGEAEVKHKVEEEALVAETLLMGMSERLGSRPAWPYLFARTAWCLGLSSSSFSSVSPLFLCAPLGACLLPLHLCLLRHCTLGSSSSTSLL